MSIRRRQLLRIVLVAIDLCVCGAILLCAVPKGLQIGPQILLVGVFGVLTMSFGLHDSQKTPGESARVCAIALSSMGWGVIVQVVANLNISWEPLAGALGLQDVVLLGCGVWFGRFTLQLLNIPTQKPVLVQGRGPRARRLVHALRRQKLGGFRLITEDGPAPKACLLLDARDDKEGPFAAPTLFGLDGKTWQTDQWAIAPAEGPGDGLSARVKRVFDLVIALMLLPLIIAILAPFAFIGLIKYPHQPFYGQIRLTRSGRSFRILKLRSMHLDAEPNQVPVWPSTHDPRITGFGKFLRNLWLDELPQVWNILRGDLSWVGPRPERPEFAQVFSESLSKYALRHQTCAGVTGLAQIRGFAGNTSLRKRLICDLEYIRTWSPWLDVQVLTRTLCQLFVRRRQPVFEFVPGDGGRIP
ncbi:MAG: lipopolysaccharide/colanic/teichoic acid biosynthesis glycosyltransferase [Planctomycetota bacterium]|jgi:lipopolysaccharide/colanic/teichoic acid biosynthesis glycosyltransferase